MEPVHPHLRLIVYLPLVHCQFFLTEDDGATIKSELTAIGSNPSESQYSISDKVITVNSANAGKNILCIYGKEGTNIEKITIAADKFAEAYEIRAIGTVKTVKALKSCKKFIYLQQQHRLMLTLLMMQVIQVTLVSHLTSLPIL